MRSLDVLLVPGLEGPAGLVLDLRGQAERACQTAWRRQRHQELWVELAREPRVTLLPARDFGRRPPSSATFVREVSMHGDDPRALEAALRHALARQCRGAGWRLLTLPERATTAELTRALEEATP